MTTIVVGKAELSNVVVAGCDLAAGPNILLDAQGDILLTAQQNTASQKTDGKSSKRTVMRRCLRSECDGAVQGKVFPILLLIFSIIGVCCRALRRSLAKFTFQMPSE
ncbi:hypothetical protein ACFZAI_01520 [Achromobacter sp. NPDC008082]|uniref:hypothetical protein n=1 Tax=Achromobacter sp. NPDC008082 TaxID=3363888 RepID=UPI0036F0C20D